MQPRRPASEVATLKGGYNTVICAIDGDRVDPSFSLIGNNMIAVTPGVHRLVVRVKVATTPGSQPSQSAPSATMSFGPQDTENYFQFICEKGHTYEFSRRSVTDTNLMVTDLKTGSRMNIDSDGPP